MTDVLYQAPMRDGHRPLSPGLYDLLKGIFGKVKIANEGEPFKPGPVEHDAVTGRPRITAHHSGEYYRVPCPWCRDTKFHLWINHVYGQPDCDGRPITWAAVCYRGCLDSYQNRQQLREMLVGFTNRNVRKLPPLDMGAAVEEEDKPAEPAGPQIYPVVDLPQTHPAYAYLIGQRRFSPAELRALSVGYVQAASPKFPQTRDRLYFPITMHDRFVGWQCRWIGSPPPGVAKYLSMPGMKRRQVLYNYDRAKAYPFVVVTEGPTDPLRGGGPFVATLGKGVSYHQRQLLLSTWADKPIYMMFDPDAQDENEEVVCALSQQRRAPVVAVPLPGDLDPADYTKEALWDVLRTQAAMAGVPLPAGY